MFFFVIFKYLYKFDFLPQKNESTVKGFKLHVFNRIKGRTQKRCKRSLGVDKGGFLGCSARRNQEPRVEETEDDKRPRGLSRRSDWKKEIGKVSTVFHSADWNDGVPPSLWDSSSGGGGVASVYLFDVARVACQSNAVRVITAYHTPPLLCITMSRPTAGGFVYKALWTNNALIAAPVRKITKF